MKFRFAARATIVLTLALACGAAQAANWMPVGKGKDGTQVAVDTASITITASVRQAWLKMVFPPHTQKGFGDNADKWVAFNLNHSSFNCKDGTSKSDSLIDNFDDGTSKEVPAEELADDRWEAVKPATALASAMKVVCEWK